MPRQEVLDDYYANYYSPEQEKITFASVRQFAGNVLRTIDISKLPTRVRLLDFGGGDGTLAHAIAQRLIAGDPDRRVDITLVDYQPPAFDDEARIRFTHHQRLESVAGLHDLILASAILEHIPGVHDVFHKLFSLSAPGGYFYARTPYIVPLCRIFRRMDVTFPAHVHDMGAEFWNRLGETFGLSATVIASRPSVIESSLTCQPMRAIAAYLMKMPARLEAAIRQNAAKDPWWKLVGGWEIVLRFNPS